MDREAWCATVHRVTKRWAQLRNWACMHMRSHRCYVCVCVCVCVYTHSNRYRGYSKQKRIGAYPMPWILVSLLGIVFHDLQEENLHKDQLFNNYKFYFYWNLFAKTNFKIAEMAVWSCATIILKANGWVHYTELWYLNNFINLMNQFKLMITFHFLFLLN